MATIQKAIKVGSSVAVVIPKKSLKALGIRPGTKLAIDIDEYAQRITVSHENQVAHTELREWSKNFMKHYKSALTALAKE